MIELLLRWGFAFAVALLLGKIVARFRLPSVLGWLIAGMVLGPYALNVGTLELLEASWYKTILVFIEFTVGTIVGTELIWKEIKKSGKSIIAITIGESIGAFAVVAFLFALIFYFHDIPFYMALIFGGIALATAPVPAFSIIKEYNAKGPVSKSLMVLAALDDIVATGVFFTIMAVIAGTVVSANMPVYMIPVMLLAPVFIGFLTGALSSWLINKMENIRQMMVIFISFIIITTLIGIMINANLPYGSINYLLLGMAFAGTVANMIPSEKLSNLLKVINPLLNTSFVLFIMNLGFPLDYQLILGTGLYSVVYMVARAIGKYFGTFVTAKIYNAPETVTNYLGLTILPHSGVSLAFTSIAASILAPHNPELANIIIGTISSAAIINEIIAVVVAKKGFQLAGEI